MAHRSISRIFASLLALCLGAVASSFASSLIIREIDSLAAEPGSIEQPDQLPHSRTAHGKRDIAAAWLAGPTTRYRHGVLGDELEASRLMVETRDADTLKFELPATRVFEDLEPRLQDLDGDNKDEILVVESDVSLGASLAVYGIVQRRITLRAMTPFLGQPNRWLNPVGTGDFDADGRLDLAIVATPHIGGVLRLYHFTEPTLSQFAEREGVSTHRIGSTELGLGQVVTLGDGRSGLLLPDQSHRALLLLRWSPNGIRELARANLPAPVSSSLIPTGVNRWRFNLNDGRHMEVRVDIPTSSE